MRLGEAADALPVTQEPLPAETAYRELWDTMFRRPRIDVLTAAKTVLGLALALCNTDRLREAHRICIDESSDPWIVDRL